ncbi:aldo-keto reductase family 1 member B1-like [Diorhabda carinulata]|uniref:aldo-keto reductase family 1 member B1-like n=1 Tax=Diorhabda carinulata TaxID=1163345 RepID=UPI0025A23F10|nr:aldo-keto reductase family 1 member B1-like [Diorhabda carinulata]
MASRVPLIKLNNGRTIPAFGLGTWKSKPGEVTQAVKDAIDAGYRHIDCAYYYENEAEVGAALKEKIASGVVKREELFITSKLWPSFMRPDLVEPTLKESLKNLCLDYLDLYLIHWPAALKEGGALLPKRPDHDVLCVFSDVDYIDTWKAMEEVAKKGLAKSIGVSNFNKRQLERVLENATIKPVNNQIECHPYLNQKKLIAFCKSKNIAVTAYSPLGSPDRPWAKPTDPILTEDPKVKAIAEKYKKSSAQVILRYLFQQGVIPIPKSVNKKRITENINIFDFELTPEDVAVFDTFDCNGRVCWFVEAVGHPHYPFNDEY